MAFIGNTVQNQGFTPAIDYFSGNGVTVTFTLSRPIASVAQIICAIDNVVQNSTSAYTVSGNSITFTSAPLSGTNNIWVQYTSLITTYAAISQDPSVIGDITATGGFLATGDFGNTYTDGTIVDYVTGNTRITTGPLDGITLYNGGPTARNALTTWTAAGNVGIGTASPARNLALYSATTATFQLCNSTTGATAGDGLIVQQDGLLSYAINQEAGAFIFGTSNAERMRIDSSGNLLVGKTTSSVAGNGTAIYTTGFVVCTMAGSTSASDTLNVYSTAAANYRFYVDMSGTIHATSVVISAISDQRLKENVRDIDTGLDAVMALKPRRFDWKEGKGQDKKNAAGFIAQEFETVFPECVGLSKAGGDGIEYKDINHESLIPTLVKAVQELNSKLEAQAVEIAALKGAK